MNVKAMVFPVAIYGYKSWTIKKAEHQKIDAFELWGGGLVAQSCLTLVTPRTAAHQAPLSMEPSRQEHWSGLPFPSLLLNCSSRENS